MVYVHLNSEAKPSLSPSGGRLQYKSWCLQDSRWGRGNGLNKNLTSNKIFPNLVSVALSISDPTGVSLSFDGLMVFLKVIWWYNKVKSREWPLSPARH